MQKFLFYSKFIIFLYMFRALLCSSSGGHIVYYTASGIVTICRWPSVAQVGRGLQTYYKTRICALSWPIAKNRLRCTFRKTPNFTVLLSSSASEVSMRRTDNHCKYCLRFWYGTIVLRASRLLPKWLIYFRCLN